MENQFENLLDKGGYKFQTQYYDNPIREGIVFVGTGDMQEPVAMLHYNDGEIKRVDAGTPMDLHYYSVHNFRLLEPGEPTVSKEEAEIDPKQMISMLRQGLISFS